MNTTKRALAIYQETQRDAPTTYRGNYCDVVEVLPAAVHPPQIIYIRDQRRYDDPHYTQRLPQRDAPEKTRNTPEADIVLHVFVAAFFGCAAFFCLYALITLMAGGRT